jgi:hypothetical protein
MEEYNFKLKPNIEKNEDPQKVFSEYGLKTSDPNFYKKVAEILNKQRDEIKKV